MKRLLITGLMLWCVTSFGQKITLDLLFPFKEIVVPVNPVKVSKEFLIITPVDDCVKNERNKCLSNPFCAASYVICAPCMDLWIWSFCKGVEDGKANKR